MFQVEREKKNEEKPGQRLSIYLEPTCSDLFDRDETDNGGYDMKKIFLQFSYSSNNMTPFPIVSEHCIVYKYKTQSWY